MKEEYLKFFNKVAMAYDSMGFSRLSERIDSGDFRNGLDETHYDIAKRIIYDFFKEHSTSASTRIFGIGIHEIEGLVKRAEEKERILNISHQ